MISAVLAAVASGMPQASQDQFELLAMGFVGRGHFPLLYLRRHYWRVARERHLRMPTGDTGCRVLASCGSRYCGVSRTAFR